MNVCRRISLQQLFGHCLVLAAALIFTLASAAAWGQGYTSYENARAKLSPDLSKAMAASTISGISWARETTAGRVMKVLIVAQPGADPDMKELRAAVVTAGGSVYYRFISVSGVLALLPSAQVAEIARRNDVQSISPNRATYRTRSLIEEATGAATVRGAGGGGSSIDGRGVGIAFLDSGIMSKHGAFTDALGGSRVKKSVDLGRVDPSKLLGSHDWTGGYDFSKSIYPGSNAWSTFESSINASGSAHQDPNGHGTLVASMAAGRRVSDTIDSTGVAPGAALYDVRVLGPDGVGDIAMALAGIDWIIVHAREYNIRVLNMSLAADSTETYMTDPLCRAVRNAVAAGVTVVVAAGNYGLGDDGRERYGTIASPGHEPSAITVGSANSFDSGTRADDAVNRFSSRGPTRASYVDQAGRRHVDNLVKPDLVAPGNRLIGALATDNLGLVASRLSLEFPQLVMQTSTGGRGLMRASGTSFSAPVVSGAVALMLQVNPGLTPPLVKAILQYTAEPLPNYNLFQQGTGLVNVPGALALAGALSTDIATRVEAGTLRTGEAILAPGKSFPAHQSTIEGRTFPWSGLVFMGGAQVLAGTELFTRFQSVYDPTISWVKTRVRRQVIDRDGGYIVGFDETVAVSHRLLTPGVKSLTSSLGSGNAALLPVPVISAGALSSMGIVLLEGVVLSDGVVLLEGVVMMEGLVLLEGLVIMEGITLMEGVVMLEGMVIMEGGAHVFVGE